VKIFRQCLFKIKISSGKRIMLRFYKRDLFAIKLIVLFLGDFGSVFSLWACNLRGSATISSLFIQRLRSFNDFSKGIG